jgi:hypothetical protein
MRMSDLAPAPDDDPDTALMRDVGVSLHEWSTRWAQIEEDWSDSPVEALEEAVDLLRDVLGERGVPVGADAASADTEDIVRAYEQARDVTGRWRRDEPVQDDELADAFNEARTALEYIAAGHRTGTEPGE